MQKAPSFPHHHRCRTGFTVVEVLVSLIVVSVGLLAIAGSTTLMLRTTLDLTRRRAAVQQAASRVAQLTAEGCDRASAGSLTSADHQLTERWVVGLRANGFIVVIDTVRFVGDRGLRSFSLASAIAC